MATVTRAVRARWLLVLVAVLGVGFVTTQPAGAFTLDDRGEMRIGMRAYTAVRVGTEEIGGSTDPLNFPDSGSGHIRQHRYFLELKLDHDIKRVAKTGWSFPWLLGWMDPKELKYTLVYRGEGEGVFDYGPSEYSNQAAKLRRVRLNVPKLYIPALNVDLDPRLPEPLIKDRIRRLDRLGRIRNRLLQWYIDYEKGPVFVRTGSQVLAWGETDVFRLLDNINPLDDSFGGFFIALDERRLPVDMIRSSYQVGNFGPITDSFLEGFVALGNSVATQPGIPNGSPWSPGGIAFPNPSIRATADVPDALQVRGGARYVANWGDATFSLAHYYTYLDVPGVQFHIPGVATVTNPVTGHTTTGNTARYGNELLAVQRFPRVPITGGSVTFPVPSWYSIVRSELAYFRGEPMNRQGRGASQDALCPGLGCTSGAAGRQRLIDAHNTEGGLDPFVYPGFINTQRKHGYWGSVLQRDTLNTSVGLDANRLIRWLNPSQTTFMSTQFFYKHVFDSPGDLVLPVPFRSIAVDKSIPLIGNTTGLPGNCHNQPCKLRPRLYHLADNRFLQTLLITTSYSAGRIVPQFGLFYDWQGAIVFQPGVTYVHDPFRVVFDYTRVDGAPTGQFGAVRDKDNVRMQFEYVF